MLVRNGGFFYRCPAFEKAYFQILFFSQKKGKKGNPRIEFSPANKKETRTCSIQKFFTELKKNSTKFQNILCVSVAKRGELEIPTKSALLFFVRGKKRKNFSYFFLLCEKTVFTTPLTRNTLSTNIPLTSLTLTFRIRSGLPATGAHPRGRLRAWCAMPGLLRHDSCQPHRSQP